MHSDYLPELISAARKKHGDILPLKNATQKITTDKNGEKHYGKPIIHGLKTWDECITVEDNIVRLWYNTLDGSTHIVAIAYRDALAGEQP